MPAAKNFLLNFVSSFPALACRHSRCHIHVSGISSGAGMSACRTWESCPLYLVRRRHAGMPEVGVMLSVSRPAPACRHAGRGSHAFIISSGVGFMLSVSRPAPICRHGGHGCHPSVCGPAPACRHAGRGNHARCILVRRRHDGMPNVGVITS